MLTQINYGFIVVKLLIFCLLKINGSLSLFFKGQPSNSDLLITTVSLRQNYLFVQTMEL